MGASRARDDRVLRATRVLSAAIVPFLVVAFAVLYIRPTDTGRLFAWPVKPTMSAMVLGAVYLGGAYFFVRVVRATQWHTVKAGFLPVGVFATLMGVATVVHWDRFSHGRLAFWLWAALYFTTPFLIVAVWLLNRRTEPQPRPDEQTVPTWVGNVIGGVGVLAGLTAAFAFLDPERAIAVWPWALTPLTGRVMGAILVLGVAAGGAFAERRWTCMRIVLETASVMLVLIAIAVMRADGQLEPDRVLTWLFALGFPAVLVGSALLWRFMTRTAAATPGTAA